mgnify:CR=1 FL=1
MNRIKKSNLILAENLVEDIMDKFEACGIAAASSESTFFIPRCWALSLIRFSRAMRRSSFSRRRATREASALSLWKARAKIFLSQKMI